MYIYIYIYYSLLHIHQSMSTVSNSTQAYCTPNSLVCTWINLSCGTLAVSCVKSLAVVGTMPGEGFANGSRRVREGFANVLANHVSGKLLLVITGNGTLSGWYPSGTNGITCLIRLAEFAASFATCEEKLR